MFGNSMLFFESADCKDAIDVFCPIPSFSVGLEETEEGGNFELMDFDEFGFEMPKCDNNDAIEWDEAVSDDIKAFEIGPTVTRETNMMETNTMDNIKDFLSMLR